MAGMDHGDKTQRLRPQHLTADASPARRTGPVVFTETVGEDRYPADIMHLAELVPVVRQRLDVPADFTDDAILSSLKRVASKTSDRERWRSAFDCNLARYLSIRGRDLGHALQELVAMIPPPRM